MDLLIAPSILSVDFRKLNEEIANVEPYVDFIHVDIMDGRFVPNITFGPEKVYGIKTKLPLDCHLMIEHPEEHIGKFADAIKAHERPIEKCLIVVHYEACGAQLPSVFNQIKKTGIRAGVAINPETPLNVLLDENGEFRFEKPDMVLIMSVHPGFGGQKFIPDVLPKIRMLREKHNDLNIEIDGGINAQTVQEAKDAGANIIVAGLYIFASKNRKEAIDKLR